MHADIKSVLYAGSRDELNAKLFERDKRIAELEAALRKISGGLDGEDDIQINRQWISAEVGAVLPNRRQS